MNYKININFNDFICFYNDLQEYFNTINWGNFKDGEILYYSSSSQFACYNFYVDKVTNDNTVELIAISE